MQGRGAFLAVIMALGWAVTSVVGGSLRAEAQPRRSVQESLGICQWTGADNGTCTSPDGGCCTISSSYLTSWYPGAYVAQVLRKSDDTPCRNAFPPTDILSLSQADVNNCNALATSNYCYVAFNFETFGKVECRQAFSDLRGYADSFGNPFYACTGSLWDKVTTCQYATRGECTKGDNASICTDAYPVFKKAITGPEKRSNLWWLNDAQYAALGKLLPQMYQLGTCMEKRLWLGGTNGNPDDPNNLAFALSNLKTYFFTVMQDYNRTGDIRSLRGTNCQLVATVVRQQAIVARCSKYNLGATAKGLPLANLAKCMADNDCELSFQLDAKGKPLPITSKTPSCRASPSRLAGLGIADADTFDTRAAVYATYVSCYLYGNRFNKTSCEAQSAAPFPNPEDYNSTRRLF